MLVGALLLGSVHMLLPYQPQDLPESRQARVLDS